MGFEDFGLDYGNPDFIRYAESYGAHGHRVERTEDFAALLERCLDGNGVHLIEVPMDYSGNGTLVHLQDSGLMNSDSTHRMGHWQEA